MSRERRQRVPSIRCPACGSVSYNPSDVAKRYCGRCHAFHDEIFLLRRLEAFAEATAALDGEPAAVRVAETERRPAVETCPACGERADGYTGLEVATGAQAEQVRAHAGERVQAEAGVPVICAYCAAMNTYRAAPGGGLTLEAAAPADLARWQSDRPYWEMVRKVRAQVCEQILTERRERGERN